MHRIIEHGNMASNPKFEHSLASIHTRGPINSCKKFESIKHQPDRMTVTKINTSNGYPNNTRKDCSTLDIMKTDRKPRKLPKRNVWHKNTSPLVSFDSDSGDMLSMNFGGEISSSPLCCNGPPETIFGDFLEGVVMSVEEKLRTASECLSEDSFIVFDQQQEDSDDFSDDSDDEDESDAESFEAPCKSKRVRFADGLEVHHMVAWSYAYQASRKGPWEEIARDRERFRRRIDACGSVLGKVFDCKHRQSVFNERFAEETGN